MTGAVSICTAKDSFAVTGSRSEMRFKDLDHTNSCIIQAHVTGFPSVEKNIQKIALVSMWGFGGSTGHSE
jgi:hypothetical protein